MSTKFGTRRIGEGNRLKLTRYSLNIDVSPVEASVLNQERNGKNEIEDGILQFTED